MALILVTGATDGIGLETSHELAQMGHEVIVHGRTAEKAQRACKIIGQAVVQARLHSAHADFGRLAEVADMAVDLASRHTHLDVLINNAGVYMLERKLSADGFEMTLAVNHIAPFLLTTALLPLLKKSADARVVTVSSIAHTRGHIDFANLNAEQHFDAYQTYANSKLANVLFANELARREPGLASNSLHPGVIDTKLLHTGFSAHGAPVAEGARTSVFLATAEQVKGISGKYFSDCAAIAPAREALDARLARELWEWTRQAVLHSGAPG
ncbi:MAG: SDR family NAD(P)-dependent oxidoreductase [Pseudomonadota bacterium]